MQKNFVVGSSMDIRGDFRQIFSSVGRHLKFETSVNVDECKKIDGFCDERSNAMSIKWSKADDEAIVAEKKKPRKEKRWKRKAIGSRQSC